MPPLDISHVFFDIGGVLGTNGWDREQRTLARERFELEDEVEQRHQEVASEFEVGRLDLEGYLECTVFFRPRGFTRGQFADFMRAQSIPDAEAIALARQLAARTDLALMTLNNESEALNLHRIETFGLRGIFTAFLSSCWLGERKPTSRYFHRALALTQVAPARSLFIDDREQNLEPARRLGMGTILFRDATQLRRELEQRSLL